jgi:hypothetical protein
VTREKGRRCNASDPDRCFAPPSVAILDKAETDFEKQIECDSVAVIWGASDARFSIPDCGRPALGQLAKSPLPALAPA